MRRKRVISLFLTALLVLSLCGCDTQTVETSNKVVELVEPVNTVSNTEQAAYRDLYKVAVYSASVYPTVREYSFDSETLVESYGAYLGEEVKKGEPLVYGSTESMDEQIEAMEEKITAMEESFAEAEQALLDNLAEPKAEIWWREDIVENYEKMKPAEYVYESTLFGGAGKESSDNAEESAAENSSETVSGGDSGNGNQNVNDRLVKNPAYTAWWKEARVHIGNYRILLHNINMQEEAFRQKKVLYELEHAYYLEQLEALKSKRSQNILSARAAGEVVAVAETEYSTYRAAAEEAIVAVANTEEKIVKCDYINKTTVTKAQEVYALIDGIRYEVEYQPMDSDEYAKITASGGKAYSTFVLKGDCSQVQVGDFAVITIFEEKKEQALSIPKDALHKDETGYYVYVMEDGQGITTPVKIGLSDGVYTEIVSGLSEGDEVLVEEALQYSEETIVVEKGSFHSTFENRGAMYYPTIEVVYNTVEHGTTYFGEYQVAQYAYVEKGDVIATIRVATDAIELQRNQTKLQRAQERLADLQAAGEEENEEAIAAKQEEIADLEELIAEMVQDGATRQIRATRSGIVVGMAEIEKETILNYNTELAVIADTSTCYVVVENTNQLLNYGNQVTITYTNNENQEKTSTGMVANISAAGVSEGLQSEYSYILLPEESIADMAVSNNNGDNWWNRYRYHVEATIREMDNVLVIPKKAVLEVNGNTYVYVKDEQGNVKACSFVAGGYDTSNYWVIEGLTEGMILCLE